MSAFVRHLHDFAREVKLTEEEFQAADGLHRRARQAHQRNPQRSGADVRLARFLALICLLNNGDRGQTETDANLLGPFWRMNSPKTENGDTIVRSPTPGPVLFVDAASRTPAASRSQGAEVDIWQSSPEGFYENQDPVQADMNLRGKFTTDAGRPYRLPQRQAGRLSDPDRRPGRRIVARARAGTICGRRICTFWSTNRASRR